MKIVLLENVKKLGKKDEVIEVADGYARNVIIAKGLGVEATPSNLNNLKLKSKNEERKEENEQKKANEDKKVIETKDINLKIKAGANGRTFGSITSKEIADGIKSQIGLDIDKRDVELAEPIKNTGVHHVKVKLHKDIYATVKVVVTEE